MSPYIGTLGRLVSLEYSSAQSVEYDNPFTFQTTMEGVVKAQARPVQRRSWNVTIERYRPNEQAAILGFINGSWGRGPFIFVSADAPHTNLLTPAVSMCDPSDSSFSQGGPVALPDGSWAARSLLGDGVANVLFGSVHSPILPGAPISAGAWVQGANAATRINWYDSAGTFIGSAVSSIKSAGAWVWSTLVALPPAGAVSAIVSAVAALKTTSPVLVWGSSVPKEWVAGEGCSKSVIHGGSRDLTLAVPGATYSNLSFTVTEVG